MSPRRGPLALIVLDGWGIAPEGPGNAVSLARTPAFDAICARWPTARLRTDGPSVGLTEGQMGNSNVGHLNIGAGRIVYQDLPRISRAVAGGEIRENPVLAALRSAPRLHLMGLLSPGGVHAHVDHALALLDFFRGQTVFVHAFLDGRDVPPKSARASLERLVQKAAETGARIATVGGRFYAMDRDRRMERTEAAYMAIVRAQGEHAQDALAALDAAYARGETDEFVLPTVIGDYRGAGPEDRFFFWNFRSDRARQISRAIADPKFDGFRRPEGAFELAGMAEYDRDFPLPAAFPPGIIHDTLGEVVSRAGRTQIRIAETEKYAHVTYFLNGGVEEPYPHEERILIPSPKVLTYDASPEMSAETVTERAIERLSSGGVDLLVLNYANADMVGHTGSVPAAVRACEAVDEGLGRLSGKILELGGQALVIADHGNAETMVDERGGPYTSHTRNLVPVVLLGAAPGTRIVDGILADVAPTILELMDIPQPSSMTGRSLLHRGNG